MPALEGIFLKPEGLAMRMILMLVLLLVMHTVTANESALPGTVQNEISMDEIAIRQLMLETWDKPEARLIIEPVVVEGDYALASWVQGERGGRAILARRDGNWQVIVCTGDGAKDPANVQQTGMPADVAHRLVRDLVMAEEKLPAAQRKQFSLFGKDMHMEEKTHH